MEYNPIGECTREAQFTCVANASIGHYLRDRRSVHLQFTLRALIAPPKSRLRKWLARKLKCRENEVAGLTVIFLVIWGAVAIFLIGVLYGTITATSD